MNIFIKEIKIKKRIRKNSGNIEGLKVSLEKVGLINPIVVDEDYNLIAGFRRFQAAKELGWETIAVTIVKNKNQAEIMDIEAEENFNRLNFTAEDYNEYLIRRKKLTEKRSFLAMILDKIFDIFKRLFDKLGL